MPAESVENAFRALRCRSQQKPYSSSTASLCCRTHLILPYKQPSKVRYRYRVWINYYILWISRRCAVDICVTWRVLERAYEGIQQVVRRLQYVSATILLRSFNPFSTHRITRFCGAPGLGR